MRYYLNIRDAAGFILDEEGAEFSNFQAARSEARECAVELLIDDLRGGGPICKRRIEISDGDGVMLGSVGFSVLLHEDFSPGMDSEGHKRADLVTHN